MRRNNDHKGILLARCPCCCCVTWPSPTDDPPSVHVGDPEPGSLTQWCWGDEPLGGNNYDYLLGLPSKDEMLRMQRIMLEAPMAAVEEELAKLVPRIKRGEVQHVGMAA